MAASAVAITTLVSRTAATAGAFAEQHEQVSGPGRETE
jgi:hypothetical protein